MEKRILKKILFSMIVITILCSIHTYVTATEVENSFESESQNTTNTEEIQNNIENTDNKVENNDDLSNEENTNEQQNQEQNENNSNVENQENNEQTNNMTSNQENNDKTNNSSSSSEESNDKSNNSSSSQGNKTDRNQSNNRNETVNENEKKESSEVDLEELKVDVEGMTPEFSRDVLEYYLIIDLSVKDIKVTAKAADSNANVTISGNKNLKEGENTININVEAEDGTTQNYYIYVTKTDNAEKANAELKKLEIKGFNIYPNFKHNIYNYNLNINEDISNLEVIAEAEMKKAEVKIEGNDELKEGENLIKIKVTAEDGTTVRTYKINTYISLDKVQIEEEDQTPALILLGVVGACIIITGAVVVIKKRK